MPHKNIKSFGWNILFLAVFLWAGSCCAQEKIITLKDGTLMKGKVLSKADHLYRIETQVLGVVTVSEADIMMIEDPSSVAPPASQMEVYQKKILENPGIVATIQELAEDKEIMDMFSDPDLKNAIVRRDVEYLKNNPKFLKFTQNPSLQKIVQEVTTQEQSPETAEIKEGSK